MVGLIDESKLVLGVNVSAVCDNQSKPQMSTLH